MAIPNSNVENQETLRFSPSDEHMAIHSPGHLSSTAEMIDLGGGIAKPSFLPGPTLTPLIRPILARVALEDLVYLSLKGALEIPAGSVRAALLDSFVRYVHPHLPVVDIGEFLDILKENEDSENSEEALEPPTKEKGSLLLVQAVMFAATAFVDGDHLRNMGFPSRRAAR